MTRHLRIFEGGNVERLRSLHTDSSGIDCSTTIELTGALQTTMQVLRHILVLARWCSTGVLSAPLNISGYIVLQACRMSNCSLQGPPARSSEQNQTI